MKDVLEVQEKQEERKEPPVVEENTADIPKRQDTGIKVAPEEDLQLSFGISPAQVRNLFNSNNNTGQKARRKSGKSLKKAKQANNIKEPSEFNIKPIL